MIKVIKPHIGEPIEVKGVSIGKKSYKKVIREMSEIIKRNQELLNEFKETKNEGLNLC